MRNIDFEQYSYLQDTYLRHFHLDLPEGTVDTYEQIIYFKTILKNILPNKQVLNKLLNVVIARIENKKRFQKLALITLIRHHSNIDDIDEKITDKLFVIFKELISTASEAIEWKLTALIKDKELSEENICWLIDNSEKSTHIVNRLLRYPKPNRRISNWADYCLKNNILNDRLSELIGVKLNFNKKFKHKDKIAFVWGVHYSKLDIETKKDLLLKNTNKNSFIEVLKISERNSFFDIISFFFHEFNKVT